MALTTVDFGVTFQEGASPPTFKFLDTTDFAGQGANTALATGVFKIVDPTNTTYYNNTTHATPDINPDVSLQNIITISLPLDASGNTLQGTYTITYTVRISDTSLSAAYDVTKTLTFEYSYTSPTGSLTMTANCVKPQLTASDVTSYRVNAIDPTITRVITLIHPAALQLADVTGTGSQLSITAFYTGENQSSLTSTLTYVFTSYTVTDTITASAIFDVDCDDLCDIYCCLRAEWNRYQDNKGTNDTKAKRAFSAWMEMMAIAGLIRTALECGKDTHVAAYTAELLKIGNCEPGCGCVDGDPVPVTGLGGVSSNDVVVDSGGAPVTINAVTVGNTTTYSVVIDAAFVAKVNNSYNSITTGGTNITVTETVAANGTKTYVVNSTGSGGHDHQTILLEIDFNQTVVPTITKLNESLNGSTFQAATIANQNNASYVDWQKTKNHFRVSDYLQTAGTNNKPLLDLIKIVSIDDSTTLEGLPVFVKIFDYNFTNRTFDFAFYAYSTGQRVAGGFLDSYGKAIISLVIHR